MITVVDGTLSSCEPVSRTSAPGKMALPMSYLVVLVPPSSMHREHSQPVQFNLHPEGTSTKISSNSMGRRTSNYTKTQLLSFAHRLSFALASSAGPVKQTLGLIGQGSRLSYGLMHLLSPGHQYAPQQQTYLSGGS